MSGDEDSSDYRLDRQDYPYFTDEQFHTFSEFGKDVLKRAHLNCKQFYTARTARYSIDHDEGKNLKMDLNIVLLGKTGCGKSSTANSILGKELFKVSRSSHSVTKVLLDNTCTYKNRRITVVDTPGVYDTDRDNATVKEELARMAFLLKDGVHCFIICMSASDTRFTKDLIEMLELIKQDGRGNFYDYCMFAYTKAETELERCTLVEFLKLKKENEINRRLLENIKHRVVAVNNKCLVPAEALRNRDALIKMVDVAVAENIQNGKPVIWTGDIFKKAGKLQEKLTSVVQDNNFHQVIVNAAIEVVINNTSPMLTFDTFLQKVISILRERESSEYINQFPDLFFTGTNRVHAKYVYQIHQIYDEMEPELNRFREIGYKALTTAAEVVRTAAAVAAVATVGGGAVAAAGGGAVAVVVAAAVDIYFF